MDTVYLTNPYRDRKGFYAHFAPSSLFLTVLRHTAIQGLVYLAEPDPQPLPKQPQQIVEFTVQRVWKPIVKDVAVSTVARIYEDILINRAHQSAKNIREGEINGGRYIRDATKAATEANQALVVSSNRRNSSSSNNNNGVWTMLQHRIDVTIHITKDVIPAPSFILNMAGLTIEQLDTLCTWLYRTYQRRQAEKILLTATANTQDKRLAYGTLATLDSINHGNGENSEAIQTLAVNIVRTGTAIVLECLGGGFGTFLFPGIGTLIGQGLGNAAAWLAI